MSRIPFKRHLVILVTCLLALGVIVPIATFAKGMPAGEQKHSVHPTIIHSAQGTTVTITTDCSSVPLQLLTSLQAGDTLTANATLTSGDPNEESEGETLVIQEQNSSFTRTLLTLDVATSTASINPLVASIANDNINACINGIDSDETGTVTFNVTPAKSVTSFKLNLRDPNESPSAELKEEGKLNPFVLRLANVAECLTEFLPFVGNVFHAGTHTLKILEIIDFRVGATSTAIAIFQDVQTGSIIVRAVSVVLEVAKAFIPFESCAELFGSYFFSTPPSSKIKPPITPVPVPTPPPPPPIANTR